ncbi:hypothetical protein MTR_6g045083 [Medicago truncatula]|uniref:Uncharacterized protein n=1 Tax=Medicago truncatula TaxID=3880 RepID=A0A072U8Y8_MEDTR|nr:hypothetical protein MTR_6g045083 [Medicago truncatula]
MQDFKSISTPMASALSINKDESCIEVDGKRYRANWLPNQAGFKVCSPVSILGADALVSELIDVDLKKWKPVLINQIFNRFEAQQILSIPLPWSLRDDKQLWHSEKDAKFKEAKLTTYGMQNAMVCNTESQNARRRGLPPMERPKYKNGTCPTLQFKMDAAPTNHGLSFEIGYFYQNWKPKLELRLER